MDDNTAIPIAIDQLRIGMYIQLGAELDESSLPVSSFRIRVGNQKIDFAWLGLPKFGMCPPKSDPAPSAGTQEQAASGPRHSAAVERNGRMPRCLQSRTARPCGCAFNCWSSTVDWRPATSVSWLPRALPQAGGKVDGRPTLARLESEALVTDCVQDLLDNTESVISLLSEGGRAQCAAPGQCHGFVPADGQGAGAVTRGDAGSGHGRLAARYRQDALAGFGQWPASGNDTCGTSPLPKPCGRIRAPGASMGLSARCAAGDCAAPRDGRWQRLPLRLRAKSCASWGARCRW